MYRTRTCQEDNPVGFILVQEGQSNLPVNHVFPTCDKSFNINRKGTGGILVFLAVSIFSHFVLRSGNLKVSRVTFLQSFKTFWSLCRCQWILLRFVFLRYFILHLRFEYFSSCSFSYSRACLIVLAFFFFLHCSKSPSLYFEIHDLFPPWDCPGRAWNKRNVNQI